MTRQTSIDCYHQIKREGLLSKRRFEVYEALMKLAPCTATELQNSIDYNNGGRDCMKRLSELRDLGVIFETGTRICRITGRNVIEWDLTDRLPIKPERINKLSRKEIVSRLIELDAKISDIFVKSELREIIELI